MAYDATLAKRIQAALSGVPGLAEKKMFGGVGYLIYGNMACGVHGDDLIVRLGLERYQQGLAQPNTRVFDMTGRPMHGWIIVTPAGISSEADLKHWITQGVKFAQTLPAK